MHRGADIADALKHHRHGLICPSASTSGESNGYSKGRLEGKAGDGTKARQVRDIAIPLLAPARNTGGSVRRLFQELKEPSEAARAVWSDHSLSDPLRREAQRAIWRRLAAPQ